jgi:hypothetical protein
MKSCVVETVHIELDISESYQLYSAIRRVTENTDNEQIGVFVEQDTEILKKTVTALEIAIQKI